MGFVSSTDSVWQENILKPTRTGAMSQFDTVLMAGNNLGIAGNLENAESMLSYLRSITSPRGRIVGEGLNFDETDNEAHKTYQNIQRERGVFPGIATIRIEYKNMVGEWFDWVHIPLQSLEEIVQKTGWNIVDVQKSNRANYLFMLSKR